ncbi:MAG: LacI family transcriptional regulator [Anaerolineae bacterium]|nr:LacI family transcriptional regulator [Anaerolineae bacterium]
MKKLTLEEVARLAGVSRATVSRVVNNPDNVSPNLRVRVQKVIEETGYQPNLAARTLASRRSGIIGLIIPSVTEFVFADPYFPVLIEGISRACNLHDLTLTLFLFNSQDDQARVYQRALGTGLLDGLIVTADKLVDPLIPELIARQIPAVYVGRPHDASQTSYVDVDNVAGSYLATSHLIRLGYQRIATITGPLDSTAGIDRRAGYVKALRERGREIDDSLIAEGDFSRDSGYSAMRRLLPHRPDAVFAASDTMAFGALAALHDAGLKTPDDVALIGFDDLPPTMRSNPPLTTIRQPVRRNGMLAVEILLDLLKTGPHPPRHIILPTELVIRATCGGATD